MMNQRTAVYSAVVTVLGEEPKQAVLSFMTKDQIQAVRDIVTAEFLAGNVELKGERTSDWIMKYTPGLVNNWMRKDGRLNGGTEYVAKNPGSRTGSGDETLKAMKQLLTQLPAGEARVAVQQAIDAKVAEIAESKKQVINIDALPEQFKALAVNLGVTIRKASDTK